MGAVGIAVAGFVASPVAGAVASAAPAMSHAPTTYSHVARAPRVPAGAKNVGAAKTGQQISGAVALSPRNPAALEREAQAVSNPKSPSFHQYVAKGEFAARYGPTAATINAVKSALKSSHLTVSSVSSNGLLVHFSGTVGSAESAFRTHIANFRMANGRTGTETTTALSFPSSIASQVTSVVGLDTLATPSSSLEHATHPATVKPKTHAFVHPAGAANACSAATGAASEFGGLTDDQIANAYGVDGLYSAGD
jgi:subtilase family serine protease